MKYLPVVSSFIVISTAVALTDVDKQCIEDNSELLPNDYLLGSWFNVYFFTHGGNFPPSCFCKEDRYTKPTADIIQQYKNKYNDSDLPYSLDDNPLLKNDSYWQGMVTGNHRAKFYVLTPDTTARLTDGYQVIAYKPLSNKYLMTTQCALRGNIRRLLAREREPPLEEMREIIKNTVELKRLEGQRLCATNKTTNCYGIQ